MISIHTPAKGVTTQQKLDLGGGTDISIHTPAKGVTNRWYDIYADKLISIHTPAKGVTTTPRSLGEGICNISIHTPAKGVTLFCPFWWFSPANFNPHSRKGSDTTTGFGICRMEKFQSTLPQRE